MHGGELTVENCTVNGKIGTPNYPYFVYQTDGNATLLQNEFHLVSDTQISTDIEFNSCIFTCGESAQITVRPYGITKQQHSNSLTTKKHITNQCNLIITQQLKITSH